ncbi:MAG: helix-turn-helix transcriptional regulator [Methanobacteriota archaeon]|nr:MAG: helix-turn-helix transcriptional regulator [Euryarchaeota archaeon]
MPDTGCCATGDCPAATVLKVLGSELKLVTMHSLMAQGRRFNELRELTGICQSSLARTLKELEDFGVAERVVRSEERPVAVEYRLTRMGEDLSVAIEAVERWAERWLTALQARMDLEAV